MTRRRGDVGRVQPAASESETDMAATIIDGKAFAATVRDKVAGHVARLTTDHGITPGLAVVLVGKTRQARSTSAPRAK